MPGKADVMPGCPLPRTPLLAPAGSCPPPLVSLGQPVGAMVMVMLGLARGGAGTGLWQCWDWSMVVLGARQCFGAQP